MKKIREWFVFVFLKKGKIVLKRFTGRWMEWKSLFIEECHMKKGFYFADCC